MAKRSKFGNKKTEYDGHVFDSLLEMRRYKELKLLEKAGEIRGLNLQPKFELMAGVYGFPKLVQVGFYRADFSYIDKGDNLAVEDCKCKATMTPVYRLKKKIVQANYGIEIREVTKELVSG